MLTSKDEGITRLKAQLVERACQRSLNLLEEEFIPSGVT